MITYTDWLDSVKALLTHPDAIKCTIFADDRVLVAWHESGKGVEDAAKELNERYRRGYDDKEMIRIETAANPCGFNRAARRFCRCWL